MSRATLREVAIGVAAIVTDKTICYNTYPPMIVMGGKELICDERSEMSKDKTPRKRPEGGICWCGRCGIPFHYERKDAFFCGPKCRQQHMRAFPTPFVLWIGRKIWVALELAMSDPEVVAYAAVHDMLSEASAPGWAMRILRDFLDNHHGVAMKILNGHLTLTREGEYAFRRLCGTRRKTER